MEGLNADMGYVMVRLLPRLNNDVDDPEEEGWIDETEDSRSRNSMGRRQ